MTPWDPQPTHGRASRLSSVLALVTGLLLLQLWLLTGALEVALEGEPGGLTPVIVVSGFCLVATWGLWRVNGRRPRRVPRRQGPNLSPDDRG